MNVLFVCTGNVFRSMAAEKCLRHYCTIHNLPDWSSDSAGTAPYPQTILPSVRERLQYYGIKLDAHQYKAVTTDLIKVSDVVIAMHHDHQDFLQKHFSCDAPLFSKLAYDSSDGIPDIEDRFPEITGKENFRESPQSYAYTQSVVDYIYNGIPQFVKSLQHTT